MKDIFSRISEAGYNTGDVFAGFEKAFTEASGKLSMSMYSSDMEYRKREHRRQEIFCEVRDRLGAENQWLADETEKRAVAAYLRLSREDGDKPESESISNQRRIVEIFVSGREGLEIADYYVDDDYTGTNFNRPGFKRMLDDIDAGRINCVIVKDLSRFGRDYIDTGHYLERVFPQKNVRFIAINDHIDSEASQYDMLLPIKNIFNEQYSRDISRKVRSSLRAKKQSGEFVGAFATYGFQKSAADKHKLEIDPPAAAVVRRIFDMFENGVGKKRIAKTLNDEGIASPSEYKRLMGSKFNNGRGFERKMYWSFPTINRILSNEMYIGNMVQACSVRHGMYAKAKKLDRSEWVVVENTHEAIIPREQWDRVQNLLTKRGRSIDLASNVGHFAGFLKCGDCGHSMAKRQGGGITYYACGSYVHHGASACSIHSIREDVLTKIILDDINGVVEEVKDLAEIANDYQRAKPEKDMSGEKEKYQLKLERIKGSSRARMRTIRRGSFQKATF